MLIKISQHTFVDATKVIAVGLTYAEDDDGKLEEQTTLYLTDGHEITVVYEDEDDQLSVEDISQRLVSASLSAQHFPR